MSEITNNPPLRKKGLLYYHQLLNAQLDAAFGSVSGAILANTDAINNIIDPDTGLLAKKADKSDIPTSLPASGGNSATVNGHKVEADVPAGAKFTDTTYDIAGIDTAGLVSTGTQHFGGYKTFPMVGIRTAGVVGTHPDSDIISRLYFTNSEVSAPFGEIQNCIRNVSYTSGEVITVVRSYSNDRTGNNSLFVIATNNNSGNYVTIGNPTVQSTSPCLRKLASGTADVTNANCPIGAWYGQHE